MERENGKGILFGVLGIMTLIIAILGASLAYFTATDRSGDDAVSVQAATVTITYVQGQIIKAENLIPATQTVAETAYAKTGDSQCLDSNDKQVCAVFKFEAKNSGADNLEILGNILTTTQTSTNNGEDGLQTREFDNLSYIVYDASTGTPVKINSTKTTFAKAGSSTELFNNGAGSSVVEVLSGTSNKYEILIWLNELATEEELLDPDETVKGNQNFEQGLKYTGVVEISVSGASDKITGK